MKFLNNSGQCTRSTNVDSRTKRLSHTPLPKIGEMPHIGEHADIVVATYVTPWATSEFAQGEQYRYLLNKLLGDASVLITTDPKNVQQKCSLSHLASTTMRTLCSLAMASNLTTIWSHHTRWSQANYGGGQMDEYTGEAAQPEAEDILKMLREKYLLAFRNAMLFGRCAGTVTELPLLHRATLTLEIEQAAEGFKAK